MDRIDSHDLTIEMRDVGEEGLYLQVIERYDDYDYDHPYERDEGESLKDVCKEYIDYFKNSKNKSQECIEKLKKELEEILLLCQ